LASAGEPGAEERAAKAKEAAMLYQRRGDFDGALALLREAGWDHRSSIEVLRQSDLAAARATAILAAILLVGCGLGMALWADARWLLFALLAWGVERAFRSVTLVRRARALEG
jgi:hypothetical protein